MLRIGEVAKTYGISNRTLRHWESAGVVTSARAENGYRYYDDENVARIKQIVLLRRLKMPIADIERIFVADDCGITAEVLGGHLAHLRHNAAANYSLAVVVENLLDMLGRGQSINDVLVQLETHVGTAVLHEITPQINLSERMIVVAHQNEYQNDKTQLTNVRILELPPMTVASYCAVSETPEVDSARVFDKFVLENGLHKRSGYRAFGFSNPEPTEDSPVYGYELWVTIPDDFEPPAPLVKKHFGGGLYASISTQLNEVGERWGMLYEWAVQSEKYEGDFSLQWFEEQVMDYETFMSEHVPDSEKQLDLLLPVKRTPFFKESV